MGVLVVSEPGVAGDGLKETGGEWCADSLEQLQEHQADRVAGRNTFDNPAGLHPAAVRRGARGPRPETEWPR